MIFTTRTLWLSDKQDVIFYKWDNRECPGAEAVYNQAFLQPFLMDRSNVICQIFNLKNDEQGLEKLMDIANKITESGFGNENLEESLKDRDWAYLLEDIFDILKTNIKNADLVKCLPPFVPEKDQIRCIHNKSNDIVCIGITHLPYAGAGVDYCERWIHALLNDFTNVGDEVILSLHEKTDWKEPGKNGYGFLPNFSDKITEDTGRTRTVKVHVFQHENFDYVVKALSMKDLPDLWKTMCDHGK